MSSIPVVSLHQISKSFGKVQAVNKISLTIYPGRILALLGENGAGKTTLMSLLAGQIQPDEGNIEVNSVQYSHLTTELSNRAGIGMVYQDFKLVETMTVLENLLLVPSKGLFFKKRKLLVRIQELSEQYGFRVPGEALIADLSMGEKQQVEILRLLLLNTQVLIFDEPTSLLSEQETTRLFSIMQSLKQQGKAIVFISHKLKEVLDIADSIGVLRQGKMVEYLSDSGVVSVEELAELMIGRQVPMEIERVPMQPKQIVLKIDSLAGDGLKEISFNLRKGEVITIIGLSGSGQKELVGKICGITKISKGTVTLLGQESVEFFASKSWDQSLSYIPEDRFGIAAGDNLDLVDNFLLTTQGGFTEGVWLNKERAREVAEKLIEDFNIQTSSVDALAGELSGGNLQKMLLARAFYTRPRLMVIEQPTQGLDVEGKKEIWQLLLKAREQAGILLVSSDLSEAVALSDKIMVMSEGQLVDIFSTDDVEKIENIAAIMTQ